MQNYLIVEFTQNASGNIGAYPSAKESEEAAYGKYYDILSRAAGSASPIHGAILMTAEGIPLEHRCFKHVPAPAPTEIAEE